MKKPAHIVAPTDDLWIEILLRLPVKSLIRFQSVSKRWLSLITCPQFCQRHSLKPKPAVGLYSFNEDRKRENGDLGCYDYISLFPHESKNGPKLDFSFGLEPSRGLVLDSCNGLFLCYRYRNGGPGLKSKSTYYVYNPTTNRSCALPQVDEEGLIGFVGWTLAFDPLKSFHYGVVCVHNVYNSGPNLNRIHVYSSESGEWTIASEMQHRSLNFLDGVYWNGSVHWISEDTQFKSRRFSVDDRIVHEMPTPPEQGDYNGDFRRHSFYLGQSCDHLYYIEQNNEVILFDVYEMKRDYSEWFVKYQVDLSSVLNAYPGLCFGAPDFFYHDYSYSIICLVQGEREEESFLVLQIPSEAIKYNIVDKTFEQRYKFEGLPYYIGRRGIQYIETLCSVQG